MKKLLLCLFAVAAYGTDCVISDTVRTPFGGYFSGRISVALNSPAASQPLYSGSQTLTGWQTTIDVPASANGAVAVTLVCTDSITPSGTSYAARYQPTSGSGWAEVWTPATGTTTIRAMRATTVPTPTVTFQPGQIAPGTNGQVLTTTAGTTAWGTPGGVTSITGTANQITASASTGAVTLSLPATITGLTSVTSTGFVGLLTGNASTATSATTATALSTTFTSAYALYGQGTGVPAADIDFTRLSAGSWRLYGQTAVTGTTRFIARAGAAQSGNIIEAQNSSGTAIAGITASGGFTTLGDMAIGNNSFSNLYLRFNSFGLNVRSSGAVYWSNNADVAAGSNDTALARNAAGVLEINNGTAGTYRDLKLRSLQWTTNTEATCNASVRGTVTMVQGGAGVADTLRVCRKDAADAYAWTALY